MINVIGKLELEKLARAVGLDQVGVTSATPPAHRDFYLDWLKQGLHGEMHYMQSRAALRCDPTTLLAGAKSIICFAWNYNVKLPDHLEAQGKVARYALGNDYHPLFKEKMQQFWKELQRTYDLPQARARFFSDSAPILERDYAARSGVGWIGKNCCLIHPQLGSWLFLGEIITDLELAETPPMAEHCGTCTACLDACPTGALTAPYTLDSKRCIAYLTIEKRGDFNDEERQLIGNHVFGCDICQEVCPWNRRAPEGSFHTDTLRSELVEGDLQKLQTSTIDRFQEKFSNSPISRCNHDGWQRNLAAVTQYNKNTR